MFYERCLPRGKGLRTTSDYITSHYCIASLRCVALLHFVRILLFSLSPGEGSPAGWLTAGGLGSFASISFYDIHSSFSGSSSESGHDTTTKISLILLYSRFEHAKNVQPPLDFGAGDSGSRGQGDPGGRSGCIDGFKEYSRL